MSEYISPEDRAQRIVEVLGLDAPSAEKIREAIVYNIKAHADHQERSSLRIVRHKLKDESTTYLHRRIDEAVTFIDTMLATNPKAGFKDRIDWEIDADPEAER